MNNRLYLLDSNFLQELATQENKTIYIKIILLNLNEEPLEQIEGVVTQGSINIDGSSAVRRSCNISLVTDNLDIHSFLWGLNSRFKVEVGLRNFINSNYPDICWFKQGTFLITTFSISKTTNNLSISISGKDKMSLLNGEVSGTIQSSTIFDEKEIVDADDNIIYEKVPIETLIREAVHTYGREPYSNIIIKDLDEYGFELLEYSGDQDLYVIGLANSMFMDDSATIKFASENTTYWYKKNNAWASIRLTDITDDQLYKLYDTTEFSYQPTKFYFQKDENSASYYIAKIEKNTKQAIGYRPSELVYAGTLSANPGEALTSVLDKIKNQLGMFEYFYNLEGQFVFQKKKEYLSYRTQIEKQDNYQGIELPDFYFFDGKLVTNISNSPNFKDIKNDFMIWGQKQSVSGANIPIWLRVAIDIKPKSYHSPWNYTDGYKKADIDRIVQTIWPDKEYVFYLWNSAESKMQKFTSNSPEAQLLPADETIIYFDKDKGLEQHLNTFSLRRNTIQTDSSDMSVENNVLNLLTDNLSVENNILIFGENTQINFDGSTLTIIELSPEEETAIEENKKNWREYIYDMARDYYKYHTADDFLIKIANSNFDYPLGITGYEQYYPEMLEFFQTGPVQKTEQVLEIKQTSNQDLGVETFEIVTLESNGNTFSNYIINGEPAIKYNQFNINNYMSNISFNNIVAEMNDGSYLGFGGLLQLEYDVLWDLQKLNIENVGSAWGVKGFLQKIQKIKYGDTELFDFTQNSEFRETLLNFISYLKNIDGNLSHYYCYNNKRYEDYFGQNIINYNMRLDQFLIESWLPNSSQSRFENNMTISMKYYAYMNDSMTVLQNVKQFVSVVNTEVTYKVGSLKKPKRLSDFLFNEIPYTKQCTFNLTLENLQSILCQDATYTIENIPPEDRTKWIDFIEPQGELNNYAVKTIGQRLKAVNDTAVKVIGYKQIPNLLFFTFGEDINSIYENNRHLLGTYSFINIPYEYEKYFSISDRGKSAEEAANDNLNKYTVPNNAITFTTFPLYWLEPNSIIYIRDENSNIDGTYTISKLTIPLAYNGTTSITANKIIENII